MDGRMQSESSGALYREGEGEREVGVSRTAVIIPTVWPALSLSLSLAFALSFLQQ